MTKSKFVTSYIESDLATLIYEQFSNLQSPEGKAFKVSHVDEGTLIVTIENQIFVVNIMEKGKLS